ncbi:MAG: NADH-quinone oxidoreductase subunit I [Deltaproteobacteria bacterium]|nr:NADH-quinone oxidoreductase subunit I [Deltaproteobacteria bacterium]MBI4796253.1 NADH-quinone oxidoreductase subunit I [Deltaproteobacteria bacterium]
MTYVKEILVGFWSLLAGMAVTIRYFTKPIVTVQYPREKIQMSPAYRGYPQLILDPETQTHRCIACEMCSRICPSQLIAVEGAKFPGEKQKRGVKYVHEHYYCSLCGLCIEVCPTTALEYSAEYRLAGYRREDAVIDHLILLQQRQKAAGVPITPVPTAEEIAAAAAAEAAAKEAREKEAKAKAAAAKKPAPAEEVKE